MVLLIQVSLFQRVLIEGFHCCISQHVSSMTAPVSPSFPLPDISLLPQSSVLLYVVSGDTLSVASMVEAAFYIGQGRKVVLFLSDIPHSPSPEANGIKVLPSLSLPPPCLPPSPPSSLHSSLPPSFPPSLSHPSPSGHALCELCRL